MFNWLVDRAIGVTAFTLVKVGMYSEYWAWKLFDLAHKRNLARNPESGNVCGEGGNIIITGGRGGAA